MVFDSLNNINADDLPTQDNLNNIQREADKAQEALGINSSQTATTITNATATSTQEPTPTETTAPTPINPQKHQEEDDDGLSTGQIIMITVISVVVALLLAFLIYLAIKSGGAIKAVRKVGSSLRKSVSRRK